VSAPLQLGHTFGSTRRRGDWRVPERVVLRQRMGSTELDLTEAELESDHITLELDMIGGSVELRIPADMQVDVRVATTLGSIEDHRSTHPGSATRTLEITGRAIWGSVEIRGPKGSRG
jgi:predicted membrane protein